jgi:hypothetical protein
MAALMSYAQRLEEAVRIEAGNNVEFRLEREQTCTNKHTHRPVEPLTFRSGLIEL